MKLISTLSGVAAIRMSGDESGPSVGMLQRDLIQYTTQAYNFSGFPQVVPGGSPVLQFRSGIFDSDDGAIPIHQLLVTSDGDSVTAQNTDLADVILTDYISRLKNDLNYRLDNLNPTRYYESVLLVELEPKLIKRLFIPELASMLNETLVHKPQTPYSIKRWTIGQDALNYGPDQPSIMQFISSDFVIERRANEPFEGNRFFCTAPLTTKDHIETLKRMGSLP